MDPGFGDLPPSFLIAFAVVGLFIAVVLVLVVTSAVRSRKVLRDSGLDPLAAPAQIAARLAPRPTGHPDKVLEQRLAELDDLHRRGVITDAEHKGARATALRGEH
jgi:cytochrome c-type biogenesis protein CcmH/NrfG